MSDVLSYKRDMSRENRLSLCEDIVHLSLNVIRQNVIYKAKSVLHDLWVPQFVKNMTQRFPLVLQFLEYCLCFRMRYVSREAVQYI